MTTVESTPGLDAFDSVSRGDLAPSWVQQGIRTAWDLPGHAVVSLIVLSENVTFKVSVGGRPVAVVRLGRPGYAATTEHVRAELHWVEALRRDADIPTPAPLRGRDGDLVQFLRDPSGGTWSAVAFDFVPGRVLEEESDLSSRFTQIGALTARLHAHARRWSPPEAFVRFEWDLDDMTGPAARWGDWRHAVLAPAEHRLLDRAEREARDVLAELGIDRSDEHFGLIHGDLRPSNVMVGAVDDDELVIIDFDDCGFGYYLYDFAAAITFYEHRAEAREMAARWLAGYQSVRPLSDADLHAASAFSMLRRLTMLGWATTHRSDALPADLWNENLPGSIAVAERFVADHLWLTRP